MCSSVYDEILEARSQGHTNLYLNYRQLSELPKELLELSKIQRLYLKRNVLKKLPADIGRLSSLVELYLHSNNLNKLPDGIGNLRFLEKLDVCNNLLKKLPPAIGNLQSLVSLHVANNELVFLPKEMENLTNLRDLNVMNNMLEWLPWQLCHCKSLKILSFDGNYIEKIPHQLIQHQGLVEISASRNKLRSIPQDVDKLLSLESFILDHNTELHVLPATILRMEHLTVLGLSISPSALLHRQEKDSRVKSLSDQSLSILHLPSHMAKLLTTPTGHCFVCDSPYFTAAFHLKESADTALRIVQPNSTNLLRVRDTRWLFYFCCCSKICLDQVCSRRDSPD
ncbi:leucine-rich repeat-containing protein 28-like isoform X3 [Montipora foliosa]|uniref:leucine-rich repeat-containing protein 28-like isoform X3 n=1 Tax=Montipora foliosa TaxID=591990 RepID=UPI0035F1904D